MAELPSPSRFREALEELRGILESEPKEGAVRRLGGVVEADLRKHELLAVVGDTHGDYSTFSRIMRVIEKEGALDEGLVVFLGDYVDRGSPEEQVLLVYELAELKKARSGRVVLLRGNHEPPPGLIPHPHDYPWALIEVYGHEEGGELYELSRKVFDSLPHALVLKSVALLVHGGPPTRVESGSICDYLACDRNAEVLEEILWNDPGEHVEWRAPSPRGAGYLWGRRVTDRALSLLEASIIIRGHEPAYAGYKFNHGGRVLTLFSRLGPPYYNAKAAFLLCYLEMLESNVRECIRTIEY